MKETKRRFRKETRTDEEKKNYIHRLSRIEGQMRGISQMIEENRAYDDVVMQMLSAINALKGLSTQMVKTHLKNNVLPNLSEKEFESVEETLNWLDKVN